MNFSAFTIDPLNMRLFRSISLGNGLGRCMSRPSKPTWADLNVFLVSPAPFSGS